MEHRIVTRDSDYCVAIFDHVVIHVWYGTTTVQAVRTVSSACETLLHSAAGAPISTIGIIEASAAVPGDDARRALATWSSNVVARLSKAAIVAEGGGFRASLVRGVGLAFTTITPHRMPFRFFGSVTDAVGYLAPGLSDRQHGTEQLLREIAALRADDKVPHADSA